MSSESWSDKEGSWSDEKGRHLLLWNTGLESAC